jgi:hypothetical protein
LGNNPLSAGQSSLGDQMLSSGGALQGWTTSVNQVSALSDSSPNSPLSGANTVYVDDASADAPPANPSAPLPSASQVQQSFDNTVANADNQLSSISTDLPTASPITDATASLATANNAGTNVIDAANGITFLRNAHTSLSGTEIGGVIYSRVFTANGQGVWVQQVTITANVTGPNGAPVVSVADNLPGNSSTIFYEQLPVGNNGVSIDQFTTPTWPAGSSGIVVINGQAQFVPGGTPNDFSDLAPPGQPGHVPNTGQNPSSMLPPLNWPGINGAQSGTLISPIPGGSSNVLIIK